MVEKLDVINRTEKINALTIICRAVGCAKSTVRIVRNNAEKIKGCAKSGIKVGKWAL
jgi:hypothetical protein